MKKIKYLLPAFIIGFLMNISSSEVVFAKPSLGGGSFCEMVSKRLSSASGKSDSGENTEESENKRAQQEENKTKARKAQDDKKNELYAHLDIIAETENQKTAIAEFKVTIDSIFATYREKQDLITSEFRGSFESMLVENKPKPEENKKEGDDQMQALFKEAKEACDSGEYGEDEIEEEFLIRSKSLRTIDGSPDFRGGGKPVSANEGGEELNQEIAELIRNKKQEMSETKEKFALEVREAKDKLREAF